jgi:hypothetical protein
MKLEERIVLFVELGKYINSHIGSEELQELYSLSKSKNPWFTLDNIEISLRSVSESFLDYDHLKTFVSKYPDSYFTPSEVKKIGIVAAGNIPLVGFQDLIHVLLSGHLAYFKASSQDKVLMAFVIRKLKELNPAISDYLVLADKLNGLDAYIATGSGNTSRYFEYYFGKNPNIIRKNRISVAVLSGEESRTQLSDLANDIFSYFGLGCRNVSKLFVPKGYDFTAFFESIEYWNSITLHSKYNNNYDYNKSIMLVNGDKHLDNGFLLVKESKELHSPISTVFYEEYEDKQGVIGNLSLLSENLQCIVSDSIADGIAFGESQSPQLWDYADNVDTLAFLHELGKK